MFRRRRRRAQTELPPATFDARAAAAVNEVGRDLVGQACGDSRLAAACMQSVFHYGAVDLDPKHLVVWVLLTGVPQDDLPAWWAPEIEVPTGADPDLAEWMRGIAAAVRNKFESVDWPDGNQVRVMFDSAERVAQGGGWSYFK